MEQKQCREAYFYLFPFFPCISFHSILLPLFLFCLISLLYCLFNRCICLFMSANVFIHYFNYIFVFPCLPAFLIVSLFVSPLVSSLVFLISFPIYLFLIYFMFLYLYLPTFFTMRVYPYTKMTRPSFLGAAFPSSLSAYPITRPAKISSSGFIPQE